MRPMLMRDLVLFYRLRTEESVYIAHEPKAEQ